MSELKPCPFCGGEAVLHPTYDMDTNEVDGWFVWCENDTCECKPETGQHFTEDEAIAAWNSRAERTCRMKPVYASNALECSECSSYVATWDAECDVCSINYCPNCGARVVV